jgi:hypothetical protein
LFNSSSLEENVTIDFHSKSAHVVVFEWSLTNPANSMLLHQAFHCFWTLGGFLCVLLLLTYRRRAEQLGTLVTLVLYSLSSLNCVWPCLAMRIIEKLMIAELRVFLFYMISFISNKEQYLLIRIGFVCLGFLFAFDVQCCVHSWDRSMNLLHGQGIAFHLCCFAVIGSMIAAMKSTADHLFCYRIYSLLIAFNFAGTLITRDLCFVFPYFDHWIEAEIAFYGIHLAIVAMLFYLHQGISRTESEGDKLPEMFTDDEQILI